MDDVLGGKPELETFKRGSDKVIMVEKAQLGIGWKWKWSNKKFFLDGLKKKINADTEGGY